MRGGRVVAVSAASALVLAVLYLTLPATGSDLSAQVARAGFFADHGAALVDLRWYGGVHPWGYSLVSPPLMALLGVRPTGPAGRARWSRAVLAGLATLLASAASPVAGLFVGLAGVALLLTRRYADGLLLAAPAAAPLAVTGLFFGEGGPGRCSRRPGCWPRRCCTPRWA
ncbi:hypothetical protein B0E53_05747 [Micromonospora sp. MH33]|nr:hypothetical protein B0E53_05747 [Micromonospora sp. MH33]